MPFVDAEQIVADQLFSMRVEFSERTYAEVIKRDICEDTVFDRNVLRLTCIWKSEMYPNLSNLTVRLFQEALR